MRRSFYECECTNCAHCRYKWGSYGGVMARLDKTFPTNDCSLCILAPKLKKSELIDLQGAPISITPRP